MTTPSICKKTITCFCLLGLLSGAASGQSSETAPKEEIIVIGVTPNDGLGLPEGKLPYRVQSASAEQLERAQSLDLSDYLRNNASSITINDAANNPLQPDVQFRGYSASPLLGLAQGIAVYQNGVRINEPLGDTVNWDLLPESAIRRINLISGANPLFGLNTLGGALAVTMKNGFNSEGHHVEVVGGSFDRIVTSAESSANNGTWGYYANLSYFDEDGWRDESASDALNFYGSLGWRGALSELNLNVQHGDTELLGNGAIPVELAALDRDAIFTAPDRTSNDLLMISMDGNHNVTDNIKLSGTAFYRENKTSSFNGDGSEYAVCEFRGGDALLEGLEEDDLEEIEEALEGMGVDVSLDDDDLCEGQFADADALEDFLNRQALAAGEDEEFDLENVDISGTGELADEAINNISRRKQESYGADMQLSWLHDLMGNENTMIFGLSYFNGQSEFQSVTELSGLDENTRSTVGLGSGTFVDEAATNIDTETETFSVYFMNSMDVTDALTLTLSVRMNNTLITLTDNSGERPELNGEHDYFRINPAVGLTWQVNEAMNVYGNYSESNRAPTPIELACNDSVFTRAQAAAVAAGEDADDVEFECRLPNAFLADPPLEDVVTRSFEAGMRGNVGLANYHLGFFHSTNNNDIIFQSTGRATGLFGNVDKTRRLGLEGILHGGTDRMNWFIAYTYLKATFENDFEAITSEGHPNGEEIEGGEGATIDVSSGDDIPGLPDHSLKLGADYLLFDNLSLGFDVIYNASQVLRGDESNQLDTLDGYAVVNLRGRYRFNDHLELFARITNLFDKDYESFGLLGEEPGEVEVPLFEDFENPRFVGPGAPRAGFVGIKLSL